MNFISLIKALHLRRSFRHIALIRSFLVALLLVVAASTNPAIAQISLRGGRLLEGTPLSANGGVTARSSFSESTRNRGSKSTDRRLVNPSATTDLMGRAVSTSSALARDDSKLLKVNGRYEFLRVVSRDDPLRLIADETAFEVVLPRENFWFDEPKRENNFRESSLDNSNERLKNLESSELDESFDDFTVKLASRKRSDGESGEFVVFTLTNLDPDERLLLRDAKDGRWDFADLLSASLIAEGLTTRESRAHYRSRFDSLLAVLKSRTNNLSDEFMKTRKAYDFLHEVALFSKYDLNCSSIAASLDKGVFNCVSATVLFNCFASGVGLDVAALETTGHAKSRVKYDNSYLDIETTCSSWDRLPDHMRPYGRIGGRGLDRGEESRNKLASVEGAKSDEALGTPGDVPRGFVESTAADSSNRESRVGAGKIMFKPVSFDDRQAKLQTVSASNTTDSEQMDLNSNETEEGFTTFGIDKEAPLGYSFTRTRRPMREITDVELVATIYYNVGVDQYQSGNYEAAIASYIKAAQLAPNNKTILGNLKATLNNWSIELATKEKKYADATRITELGLFVDPEFREFKMNMPIFFHDWIDYLAKDNKWDEIKDVQDLYWKMFPEGDEQTDNKTTASPKSSY